MEAQVQAKRDVAQLAMPAAWPLWPVLPVKRMYDDQLEVGWVTADFPTVVLRERPTVKGILTQLRFELSVEEMDELGHFDPRRIVPESARPLYEAQILHSYHDAWALVDDGWTVD
jgi:hypothetical protein